MIYLVTETNMEIRKKTRKELSKELSFHIVDGWKLVSLAMWDLHESNDSFL